MTPLTLSITTQSGQFEQTVPPDSRQVIGRSRYCDIPIRPSQMARRHAEIRYDAQGLWLRALSARHPLLHDGEPVREVGPLAPGDPVELADVVLQRPASDPVDPSALVEEAAIADEPEAPAGPVIGPALARQFQEAISQRLDLYQRDVLETLSTERLREEAQATAWALLNEDALELPPNIAAEEAVQAVVAETVGLGPIEPLLADNDVSEIMVNGPDRIYVERHGRLELTPLRFSSSASLFGILDRIVSPLGRRLDEGSPLVDGRLPDGSRVNAIIPPLALGGATLTIRRFPERHLTLKDLVKAGALSDSMAQFLQICIEQRRNIIIAGGTGTGKTTVLNALSGFIAEGERIVTIEDSAELRLQQDHVVALESRPANIEGSGEITIRDLVRNALRMRPDRILVGECRGGEALDMLQAMNTGHDGSLTTAHANSPRDAVARLEVMTMMAGFDLPVRAIREQISSAVDIIVQLTRFGDGARRITKITEVDGMEGERILLNDLFVYHAAGGRGSRVAGHHAPTGLIPSFIQQDSHDGGGADLGLFQAPTDARLHETEFQAGAL